MKAKLEKWYRPRRAAGEGAFPEGGAGKLPPGPGLNTGKQTRPGSKPRFGLVLLAGLLSLLLPLAPASGEGPALPPSREPLRLTLEESIKLGLERNPQLALSAAQADQAAAKTIQAKAARYPTLTFTGSVARTNRLPDFKTTGVTMFPTSFPAANPSGGVVPGLPNHIHLLPFPEFEFSSTREGEIYMAKIETQYAIWAGGRIKNGIEAARLNEQAAQEQVRQQRNELIFNIQQAFYGVLLSQEMIKVVEEAYRTAASHLQQVKAFYREGLASNLDVLKVESMVASIEPQRVEARNGNQLAQLLLKNLLNLDPSLEIEAVGELEYQPRELPLPQDLYATALENRPEVKAMALRKKMAEKMLEISKAEFYPTVGLSANYGWDRGQETPPNDKIWREGYQAGIGVSIPLFDGNAAKGKVEEARAMVRQAELGMRALELGVKAQVEQAALSVEAARKKILAQEANVKAAEKSFQVAKARYEVGLATNLDLMDAETQLAQAKAQRLQAIHEYNLALAQLNAALGMPEEK